MKRLKDKERRKDQLTAVELENEDESEGEETNFSIDLINSNPFFVGISYSMSLMVGSKLAYPL